MPEKFPKTLGACVDLLYTLQQERLELQRQAEEIGKRESVLKEHLIQTIPKSDATGVAGKLARVTIDSKPVPKVNDWPKFYAYIKKHDAFDLLQRRVGEGAVKERWDAKENIPGVERFNAPKVHV